MAHIIIGMVTSAKADKTIVVSVRTQTMHPIYKKQYALTRKFMAHDENNEAKEGDKVQIAECRPLSARKHFSLVKILEPAHIKHTESEPKVEVK